MMNPYQGLLQSDSTKMEELNPAVLRLYEYLHESVINK